MADDYNYKQQLPAVNLAYHKYVLLRLKVSVSKRHWTKTDFGDMTVERTWYTTQLCV